MLFQTRNFKLEKKNKQKQSVILNILLSVDCYGILFSKLNLTKKKWLWRQENERMKKKKTTLKCGKIFKFKFNKNFISKNV